MVGHLSGWNILNQKRSVPEAKCGQTDGGPDRRPDIRGNANKPGQISSGGG